MKLKSLIVDDEPLSHKVILEYAQELPYLDVVAQAYLPMKALQILKEKSIDLIFLDIQMPKLSGLEMLRLLDNPPEVIVTTAFEEYALEGYELKVCDYLLKPFRLERFVQATEKALENYKLKHPVENANEEFLLIKSDKRIVQVSINDIYYLESYGNYVKVWTTHECLITAKTLSSFGKELPSNLFFRIHKSFLINKTKIEFLEGNSLTLKNKKQLALSKNYKQDFMEFMLKA